MPTNYGTLLIDDLRSFLPELSEGVDVTTARTLKDGLELLERQPWRFIWLDHDLGLDAEGNTSTIMPVVNRLSELAFFQKPVPADAVFVHTSSPVGADMVKTLRHYGYRVVRVDAKDYFETQG